MHPMEYCLYINEKERTTDTHTAWINLTYIVLGEKKLPTEEYRVYESIYRFQEQAKETTVLKPDGSY